jgi:predicted amidophosphoribosyltransferase
MTKGRLGTNAAEPSAKFEWPPVEPESPVLDSTIKPKPSRHPARTTNTHSAPKPLEPIEPGWISQLETALLGTHSRILTGRDSRWVPEPPEEACPRCGRSVGLGEFSQNDGACIDCRPERLGWDRLVRLGEFGGDLREAIHAIKYEAWRSQGTQLGRLLGYRLTDALSASGHPLESAVLVPVPMPPIRRISRGIDHSMVLARGVSSSSGVRLVRMLSRSGGLPQVNVAPSLRAGNLRNKIRLNRTAQIRPRIVILVDDVKTTGATLRACSRAIRGVLGRAETQIWAGVIAVSSERNRRSRTDFNVKA